MCIESTGRQTSMNKIIGLFIKLVALAATNVYALDVPTTGIQPHGLQRYCSGIDCVDSLGKFKNIYTIKKSNQPQVIPKRDNLGWSDKAAATKINSIFERNPAAGILLIDNGQIIFERYDSKVNEKTPLLGYSMSKSLTSINVGKGICSGLFDSINTPAKKINPSLEGLSFGDATLRELLMMSSGSIRGTLKDGGNPKNAGLGNPAFPNLYWDIPNQLKSFGKYGRKQDGEFLKPGEEFNYKNLDTQALALLFKKEGDFSFQDFFEKNVWHAIGAESDGYWIHDKNGIVHTPSSFHATLKDWGRVALYLQNLLITNDQNDCFTNYVKDATSQKIKNRGKEVGEEFWSGRSFSGYGYQFWTNPMGDSPGTFYMLGYRGQRIAINPNKKHIMVVISSEENYMGELYDFFAKW